MKLIANSSDNLLIVCSRFKRTCQTFADSSLLHVRVCCFSWLFLILNKESLGFKLFVGQKKQFEGSFLAFLDFFPPISFEIL